MKIRGHRIELEEIEHVLAEHNNVQAAVVLARDDVVGEVRLIAHIVAASRREPKVNELRDFLKAKLPEYMIPTGFVFLDRLPLTAHGKVDRPALARIRQNLKVAGSEFVAPRDTTEEVLSRIWAGLLAAEKIGVFDNFFDLGGHSLLAGRALARVAEAFGVSLPLRALFEAPTVAALARRISEARETQSIEPALEIARGERDGPQPVSILQEHMLRIERDLPGLPQFNLPFAYRLQGPLNVPALKRSLAEVVRRHDSLRMGFAGAGDDHRGADHRAQLVAARDGRDAGRGQRRDQQDRRTRREEQQAIDDQRRQPGRPLAARQPQEARGLAQAEERHAGR